MLTPKSEKQQKLLGPGPLDVSLVYISIEIITAGAVGSHVAMLTHLCRHFLC